jgi:hypothetical protein
LKRLHHGDEATAQQRTRHLGERAAVEPSFHREVHDGPGAWSRRGHENAISHGGDGAGKATWSALVAARSYPPRLRIGSLALVPPEEHAARRARCCAIVPAYEASRTVAEVVRSLRAELPELEAIIVVDDGSKDRTALLALEAGADVVRHRHNLGKGAALLSGLERARELGFDVAISVDADGQHPAVSARTVLFAEEDPAVLVMGVRDMVAAGAPPANIRSNSVANFWLSSLTGTPMRDTQCGLRRYPVSFTLDLDVRSRGYAFESEILLRGIAGGMRVHEVEIDVLYPPEKDRLTHFRDVRDVTAITLVITLTFLGQKARDIVHLPRKRKKHW